MVEQLSPQGWSQLSLSCFLAATCQSYSIVYKTLGHFKDFLPSYSLSSISRLYRRQEIKSTSSASLVRFIKDARCVKFGIMFDGVLGWEFSYFEKPD
jgi:hypothetical protein